MHPSIVTDSVHQRQQQHNENNDKREEEDGNIDHDHQDNTMAQHRHHIQGAHSCLHSISICVVSVFCTMLLSLVVFSCVLPELESWLLNMRNRRQFNPNPHEGTSRMEHLNMLTREGQKEIPQEMRSSTLWNPLLKASAMEVDQRQAMKDRVKDMFWHAYSHYMDHAFPQDELKPLTCKGMTTWGNYSLTLIDTLDTLLVMGHTGEFLSAVTWVIDNVHFDADVGVSIFETNIRVVGGLLSAHQMLLHAPVIQRPVHEVHLNDAGTRQYNVEKMAQHVLEKVRDLVDRLMPAFETKTGIPFGYINLRNGVLSNETTITSVAGGGTHLLEFTLLSLLTGDDRYAQAAHKAAVSFYRRRDAKTGLLGNHINIESGRWKYGDAGIGSNVDSYFEYLVKAYSLFGRDEYWQMFITLYSSVIQHNHRDPWYIDVEMSSAVQTWTIFNSLMAFWPGLQTQLGGIPLNDRKNHTGDEDLRMARDTLLAFHGVWRRFGSIPEGFNIAKNAVQPGQKKFPLRPEMIESIYLLYRRTKDPLYLLLGRDFVHSVDMIARTACGFATVQDVETRALNDRMESFFLAETLKYALLLFDEEHWIHKGHYIFNTEAHIIPARVEYLSRAREMEYDDKDIWTPLSEMDKMCSIATWWDNLAPSEMKCLINKR